MRSWASEVGFRDRVTSPEVDNGLAGLYGAGLFLDGVAYSGLADWDCGGMACEETEETKFSVRLLEARMFCVRSSRTSLKLADTSVSFPCSKNTTFLACSVCCVDVAAEVPGRASCCKEEMDVLRADRSCFMM